MHSKDIKSEILISSEYRNNDILNDKFDYINSLEEKDELTEFDLNNLKALSEDTNSEIRYLTTELLGMFNTEICEKILIERLKDKDYLVRTSACDSLTFCRSDEALNAVKKLIKDKSCLVRGHAVYGSSCIHMNIGLNNEDIVNTLKLLLKNETSEYVKIATYGSLCLIGKYEYETNLFSQINNRYYRNRCFALSLIEDVFDREKVNDILKLKYLLNERLQFEKATSVKDKIQILLTKLK